MNRRLIAVFCLFALASMGLYFRVGAIATSEELEETAQSQSSYTLTFDHTRGQIYDCRMLPLVDQEEEYVAACLPTPENMAALPKSASLAAEEGTISELMETGRPFLAKSTLPKLNIPNVKVFPVKKRYSIDQPARHIIGYLDDTRQGVTGIEKAYNDFLDEEAAVSSVTYKVDGRRNPLLGSDEQVNLAPVQTRGVVLTIDKRIQKVVEEVGQELLDKGAIVVMEPKTGKIRAIASFPQYKVYDLASAVKDSENSPMLNRAFSAYNVGSTFKIVTSAAALTQGISAYTEFFCAGKVDVLTQTFKCHNENGHGMLDLKGALEASCNPYFIQLGQMINKDLFLNMAKDLSFGKATTFADGMSTVKGYVPTKDELYNPAAVANFSFGQGTLMATPVQVARMVCAVVNGGSTPEASLVEGTTLDGKLISERSEAAAPVKAMSESIAEVIRQDLVSSVMEEPNQNAKPQYVTAGGKTGTAQTGQIKEDGEELLQGWFAGFFPAEDPEYVVVVLSEDASSGNQDASPVFREIADRLNAPLEMPRELRGE